MRCPRCHRETSDPTPAFCRGCGAPLRLGDEPPVPPLDVPLPLDRRGGERAEPVDALPPLPPGPTAPSRAAASGELASIARSHWDLGAEIGLAPPPEPRPATAREVLPEAEVDALEVHLRRPESWRRAAAAAVDVLPFLALGVALARALVGEAAGLAAPATGIDGLLDLVARERVIVLSVAAAVTLAVAVYATLAHALAGATLGKRLLGLRVAGPDGGRPSLGRSGARAALAILSAALLGLGLLLALFTRSGRALHDLAARTWVVDAR